MTTTRSMRLIFHGKNGLCNFGNFGNFGNYSNDCNQIRGDTMMSSCTNLVTGFSVSALDEPRLRASMLAGYRSYKGYTLLARKRVNI